MAILILNILPYQSAPYDEWLSDIGEEVLLLTSEETYSAHRNSGNYKLVMGFQNFHINGNVELEAAELFEQFGYRAVVALSELDLLRAARIRDRFMLPGQSVDSSLAFRDKVYMKSILQSKNIAVPNFCEIDSVFDIYDFVNLYNYPVVIKPVDGSASEGVEVINHLTELKSFVHSGFQANLEIEEYVQGEMYCVDGLVINNEVYFIWASKYVNGCLAYKDGDYSGAYILPKEHFLLDRLTAFIRESLGALPTPDSFAFHAEVFHTVQDQLIICEIASRAGGGKLRELVFYTFGLQLNKLMTQAQCSMLVKKTAVQMVGPLSGFLYVYPKSGRFMGAPSSINKSWVKEYQVFAQPGQLFSGPSTSIDKIAFFIVQGENELEIISRLKYVHEWFDNHAEWA